MSAAAMASDVTTTSKVNTDSTTTEHDLVSASSIFDNVDLLQHVVKFIGGQQYRFVAAINRSFRIAYQKTYRTKRTNINASTIEHANICLEELNDKTMIGYFSVWNMPDDYDDYDKFDDDYEKNDRTRMLESLICRDAARRGNLAVLQYLKQERHCAWDAHTCTEAAFYGHLNVLKWAREHNCPWNTHACKLAAAHADLEVLIWLKENGCPWDKETLHMAALSNRLEVVAWAFENGCPCDASVMDEIECRFGYKEWQEYRSRKRVLASSRTLN